MSKWQPRRMPSQFLTGAPDGILDMFDNPEYADRYTVIYREVFRDGPDDYVFGRGMSANPFHPQGVGLSFEMKRRDLTPYRSRNAKSRISWADLPDDVKRCVMRDLNDMEGSDA